MEKCKNVEIKSFAVLFSGAFGKDWRPRSDKPSNYMYLLNYANHLFFYCRSIALKSRLKQYPININNIRETLH